MTELLKIAYRATLTEFYHFSPVKNPADRELSHLAEELLHTGSPYRRIELFEKLRYRWERIRPDKAEYNLLLDCCLCRDMEIRREAAHLLLDEALIFTPVQNFILYFALKDWEKFFPLVIELDMKSEMYKILLEVDYRTRLQAIRAMPLPPENSREICLIRFISADFASIIDDLNEENQMLYEELMLRGVNDHLAPLFFRKECRQILDIIRGGKTETPQNSQMEIIQSGLSVVVSEQDPQLSHLMERMREKGLWLDGNRVFPEMRLSVTGRIIYRKPGVQTIPAQEKPFRLKPPSARYLIKFDFSQIEPRLALNWMVENLFLEIEEIPEDIYLLPFGKDREESKKMVNTLINGGTALPENSGGFVKKFLHGIWKLRQHLQEEYSENNTVQTIASREIKVDSSERNLGGKLVNRFIQGSAADYFHDRILALEELLRGSSVRLYFLLYDEAWFYADERFDISLQEMEKTVNTAPDFYTNHVPISAEFEKLYWNGRWMIDRKDTEDRREVKAG